ARGEPARGGVSECGRKSSCAIIDMREPILPAQSFVGQSVSWVKLRARRGPREAEARGVRGCTLRASADRERSMAKQIGPARGGFGRWAKPPSESRDVAALPDRADVGAAPARRPLLRRHRGLRVL